MGKISYLFADYIKDLAAGNITLINEDANYPTENSQNEQVALTTRTTDKVNITYRFDLGANKALQAFAILNHNFSGGNVQINQYNAGWAGKVTVETKTVRLLDMYHYEASAPAAKQLWEFDFTNAGTVTSAKAYLEFGRIMVYDGSNPVQITDIEDWKSSRGYGFRNIINETIHGIRWVHKLAEKRERFELGWNERKTSDSIASELRALYEAVYGDAHPFVYIPDIGGTDCHYVYIEDPELLWAEIFGTGAASHVGNFILRLIEAVRGKT